MRATYLERNFVSSNHIQRSDMRHQNFQIEKESDRDNDSFPSNECKENIPFFSNTCDSLHFL